PASIRGSVLLGFQRDIFHLLTVAAIQSAGQPQDRSQLFNSLLILRRKLAEVSVLLLGPCSAMITGYVCNELQLSRAKTGQSAVENQMITVFVMLIVVDEITDILQSSRRLQKRPIG